MRIENGIQLTREKHLNHMVKVVPFVVMCYAIQCFIVMKLSPTEFSSLSLSILGGLLALMVAGLITYDLKHRVYFGEKAFHNCFFNTGRTIPYEDILEVQVTEPSESFSTMIIITKQGKETYYFVDDAIKIKAWLDAKKYPEQHQKMAA